MEILGLQWASWYHLSVQYKADTVSPHPVLKNSI